MNAAEQPPQTQHRHDERGRLVSIGHRTDTGTRCTLLVIHEPDGSWSFHSLGALAGVKLGKADTVALADSILRRAR